MAIAIFLDNLTIWLNNRKTCEVERLFSLVDKHRSTVLFCEAVAWIPKGGRWPRNAKEYPRHEDWLTLKEASEFLGVSQRKVEQLVYETAELSFCHKEWRYGRWRRQANFISRAECQAWRIKARLRLFKRLAGLPNPMRDQAMVEQNPLRKWRKDNGLSAKRVGVLLGVGEGCIAAWEHSRQGPSEAHLHSIGGLLQLPPDVLRERWKRWREEIRDAQAGLISITPRFNKP